MNNPIGDKLFQNIPHRVHGKVLRKSAQGRRKIGGRKKDKTRMWANAQHDGRPAEYRWRPLFNVAKFG